MARCPGGQPAPAWPHERGGRRTSRRGDPGAQRSRTAPSAGPSAYRAVRARLTAFLAFSLSPTFPAFSAFSPDVSSTRFTVRPFPTRRSPISRIAQERRRRWLAAAPSRPGRRAGAHCSAGRWASRRWQPSAERGEDTRWVPPARHLHHPHRNPQRPREDHAAAGADHAPGPRGLPRPRDRRPLR
jgi:hypothetical protein